jgi:hemerythrin superfamily protein
MATSILELLKRDHQKVATLLAEIEAVESDEQREQMFARLVGAIEVHAQAEEDVFYGTLAADELLAGRLDDARQEHDEVDQLLEEMDEIGSAGEEWTGKLRQLRQLIQQHVDQEEGPIFARAQEVLGPAQLERLGDELERAKQAMSGLLSGEMKAIA